MPSVLSKSPPLRWPTTFEQDPRTEASTRHFLNTGYVSCGVHTIEPPTFNMMRNHGRSHADSNSLPSGYTAGGLHIPLYLAPGPSPHVTFPSPTYRFSRHVRRAHHRRSCGYSHYPRPSSSYTGDMSGFYYLPYQQRLRRYSREWSSIPGKVHDQLQWSNHRNQPGQTARTPSLRHH